MVIASPKGVAISFFKDCGAYYEVFFEEIAEPVPSYFEEIVSSLKLLAMTVF